MIWLQTNNDGQAALDALANPKRAEQLQLAAYLTSATNAPAQVCLSKACQPLLAVSKQPSCSIFACYKYHRAPLHKSYSTGKLAWLSLLHLVLWTLVLSLNSLSNQSL